MKKFFAVIAALTAVFGITAMAAYAAQITEAQAKDIALKHAGVSAQQAHFTKMKLDRDFGRSEYELEFFVGNVEYDYEIDAADGTVRKFSRETHAAAPFGNGGQQGRTDRRAEGGRNSAREGAGSEARARTQAEAGLRRRDAALRGRDFLQLPRIRVRDQRADRRSGGLGNRLKEPNVSGPARSRPFLCRGARSASFPKNLSILQRLNDILIVEGYPCYRNRFPEKGTVEDKEVKQ